MNHPLNPQLPSAKDSQLPWPTLPGASMALALSNAAREHSGPLLVVTPDTLTANQLTYELAFFNPDLPVLHLPDWETLPYDNFSPHQDIISQRLATLYQLPNFKRGILLVPVTTLMYRLLPQIHLDAHCFLLKVDEKLDQATLCDRLLNVGYQRVSQVMEHGEFTVRGAIIDLFPMGSSLPYRLDYFDDSIDSIRTFDPDTQRSIDTIKEINLLPAQEFPLDKAGIERFRSNWRQRFAGNPMDCPTYQSISQGFSSPGIEYYLPLFFEKMETLFDYLPSNTLIAQIGDLPNAAENFWQEVKSRYEQRQYDQQKPILAPAEFILPVDQFFAAIKNYSRIQLPFGVSDKTTKAADSYTLTAPNLFIDAKAENPLSEAEDYLKKYIGRVLFCVETAGRRSILLELLQKINCHPQQINSWAEFLKSSKKTSIIIAPLENGFCLSEPMFSIITENQLFGQQVMQRRQRKSRTIDPNTLVRNLTELEIGAPIVHIDHGVGRYLGLKSLNAGGQEMEYLALEYSNEATLFVPVSSLHLISRYSGGDTEHAPLHRLGSDRWGKAKRKAAEKARDIAAELLDVYSRRAAREGYSFKINALHYSAFASSFPFEETPDQARAIEDTLNDMRSSQPMDRLICGDVGFGKTEVAMRAAFAAVQDEKQVAILVPTTLLAQQHYENFLTRFADWPINIAVISRFQTKTQVKESITKLAAGTIDILIGTHRVLQKDIHFKELGLLIIDEEHRFGVTQKEKLKSLRSDVDILTLTATPIPRTLNMALAGTRDLSIIATPPAKRLSVKTFVLERDLAQTREAILRELSRGGQIYYLHNRVESIERLAEELTELVPEARIAIAHGQMNERELERVMTDFYHQRFQILVCTTIIENGIDIPTANTIIIDRADRFGLAQLHQLRGRVGRSHHQAYAYLFTPGQKLISRDAKKRLDAIASLQELGIGYTLASQDLEIRGAGELLGDEQSGHLQEIGFSLYMELLDRAVQALKSGVEPSLDNNFRDHTEIDLQLPSLIPADYLHDVHLRLQLYKRIANAKDSDALREIQVEMIDRFGLLNPQINNLFSITLLKLQAQKLGIVKITLSDNVGVIAFNKQPKVKPGKLIELIQKQHKRYQLHGPENLKFILTEKEAETKNRVESVEGILGELV